MDVRQLRALIDLIGRAFAPKKHSDKSGKKTDDRTSYLGLLGTYANLMACLTWPLLQKHLTIWRL